MTWLVWRQYRFQFVLGAALLAAFAVLIVITGERGQQRGAQDELKAVLPPDKPGHCSTPRT